MSKLFGTKPTFPPVENRRTCPGCNKPLVPKADIKFAPDGCRYTGTWSYACYGHFCTLRCATKFANACIDKLGRKHPNGETL
jgi:hypothetical protein